MWVVVRGISGAIEFLFIKCRVAYYNLTLFGFFRPIPWSTTIYGRIRVLHRPCRVRIGVRCRLGDGLYLATSRSAFIDVADDVNINLGCVLVAMDRIRIGPNTSIAEYVTIRDQEHRFGVGVGVRGQGYNIAAVEIGENVWIGRGAYIGPGTTIGPNSIVGANSVVRGTFPPGVLIAGAPAKIKRNL
jgi:acetyltransferase-like isoleucine patch superfamily enzyme